MGVRAPVSQNDLRIEFGSNRQYDFLENQPIAFIPRLHGHGQVDGVPFPSVFPGLVDEPRSRIQGVRVLVDVDEKNPGVLVEIFRCSVAGVGVGIQNEDSLEAIFFRRYFPAKATSL